MDPISAIALITSLFGTGFSLAGQSDAKKDAEKAQKEAEKNQLWANMMNVLTGHGAQSFSPQAVPGVDYGGAIRDLGNAGLFAAGRREQRQEGAADVGLDPSASRQEINTARAAQVTENQEQKRKLFELENLHTQATTALATSEAGKNRAEIESIDQITKPIFPGGPNWNQASRMMGSMNRGGAGGRGTTAIDPMTKMRLEIYRSNPSLDPTEVDEILFQFMRGTGGAGGAAVSPLTKSPAGQAGGVNYYAQ